MLALKAYFDELPYDPLAVYKSCHNYVVRMLKLSDTITNESRYGVHNKKFAKFRGSKFLVTHIVDKLNPSVAIEQITNSQSSRITTYKINEIVIPDKFDTSLDRVCTNGIHYFLSIEAAFYYDLLLFFPTYTGELISYHDNGSAYQTCSYIDGKKNGTYRKYDTSGNLIADCELVDCRSHGKYREFTNRGILIRDICLENGQYHGWYRTYYEDGTLKLEKHYEKGSLDGPYREYFPSKKIKNEYIYKNNIREVVQC